MEACQRPRPLPDALRRNVCFGKKKGSGGLRKVSVEMPRFDCMHAPGRPSDEVGCCHAGARCSSIQTTRKILVPCRVQRLFRFHMISPLRRSSGFLPYPETRHVSDAFFPPTRGTLQVAQAVRNLSDQMTEYDMDRLLGPSAQIAPTKMGVMAEGCSWKA